MSGNPQSTILTELRELKKLERRLLRTWSHLARAGRTVHQSFLSSLKELDFRTQRLEWLLLDPQPPLLLALKKAA
jgi:hypothetical protein